MIVLDLRTIVIDHWTTLEHMVVDLVPRALGLGKVPVIVPIGMMRAVRMLGLSRVLGMRIVIVSILVRHWVPRFLGIDSQLDSSLSHDVIVSCVRCE